jgi:hypothetical protein
MRNSEEGGSKAEKLEARQSADTEVLALDSPSNHRRPEDCESNRHAWR